MPRPKHHRKTATLPKAVAALLVFVITLGMLTVAAPAQADTCAPDFTYVITNKLYQRSNCGTSTKLLHEVYGSDLSLSPNGQYVAYGVDSAIRVFSTRDSSDDHFVANGKFPVWAPDSNTIVYGYGQDYFWEGVYKVDRSGGNQAPVFVNPYLGPLAAGHLHDADPAWSHDGTLLATVHNDFRDSAARTSSIYTQAPNGTGRQLLYTAQGQDYVSRPIWTPDDKYIVFTLATVTSTGYELKPYAVPVTGGTAVKLNTPASLGTETRLVDIAANWTAAYKTDSAIAVQMLGGTEDPVLYADEQPGFVSGVNFRPGAAASPPAGWLPGAEPLPTPTPGPGDLAVKGVQITAASSDRLLTRTIKVVANDPTKVSRYEYAWAKTPTGNNPGATVQRCPVIIAICRLNYGPTNPDTTWNLLARAVGTDGKKGDWFTRTVKTPKPFILVVFGDSIPAGLHRDSEGARTICEDETYSFGQTIWDELQAQVPPQWRLEHGYINVAKSGFGTNEILNGGQDACGDHYDAQVPEVVRRLSQNTGSWNMVVGNGGVNNGNWGDVLGDILKDGARGKIKTAKQCQAYINHWDFSKSKDHRDKIFADSKEISQRIAAADGLARQFRVSYYSVVGTGTWPLIVPQVCKGPLSEALASMHTVLKDSLDGSNVTWVNTDNVIGSRDELLQDLYPSNLIFPRTGWPHPNRNGAAQIGIKVLRSR